MSIFYQEENSSQGFLPEYSTSNAEVFRAGVEEAIADNPFTRIKQYTETQIAEGRVIPKKEAEEQARAAGVQVHNLDDGGIKEGALARLIERQYQKKVRQETIAAAEPGFMKGTAELTGGLVGSLIDPIGFAMNFFPVVGQAKYAGWLAKAAGPMERAAIRGAVGAAEGAVGAALLEPLNYTLAGELGDDYTMANSLMNIAFGTAMGGGLHMGGGALSDAFARGRSPDLATPKGEIPERLAEMPHEARVEMGQAAIAQLADDRPVEVHLIAERASASREERTALAKTLDPEAWDDAQFDYVRAERDSVQETVNTFQSQIDEIEPKYAEAVTRLEEIDTKLRQSENLQAREVVELREEEMRLSKQVDQYEQELTRIEAEQAKHSELFNTHDTKFREMNQRRKDSYQKAGQQIDPREEFRWKQEQDEKFKAAVVKQATTEPEPTYIPKDVLDRMNEEINNLPPETAIEEAKLQLEEGEVMLKEQLDQMGLERPEALVQADENVKLAQEHNAAVESFARCAARRG
jgi:hypothetical protein